MDTAAPDNEARVQWGSTDAKHAKLIIGRQWTDFMVPC